MTKSTAKNLKIYKHINGLMSLMDDCNVVNHYYRRTIIIETLYFMENRIKKIATQSCNGKIKDQQAYERELEHFNERVNALFNGNLRGFFIDTDPRGYALKIKPDIMQYLYPEMGLQLDSAGYGLLAPKF